MFLLRETYEDWQTLTSKFLESAKFSIQVSRKLVCFRPKSLDWSFLFRFKQWLFNILKHDEMPKRNHSLNNVIANLHIASDYYQRATLEMPLRGNEGLFEA